MTILQFHKPLRDMTFSFKKLTTTFRLFVMLLLAFIGTSLNAQDDAVSGQLEFTGTYGYMFGGQIRAYEGNVNIGDDDNFTLHLNYTLAPGTQFEMFWMHQESDVRVVQFGGFFDYEDIFDLNTDYIQLGVLKELKPGPVRPFGSFTMGTAIYSPQTNAYDDVWRFAFSMGGGVKAYLSDRVGLRFQGRLMMPVYFSGVGLFCGSGGCSAGLGAGSAILQGDLSAGLIIVLK